MKKLTQVVLESGLLDKTMAALMERWGFLEPGASDRVTGGTVVISSEAQVQNLLGPRAHFRQTLENFVEELELLLQPEAIERGVTDLDQSSDPGVRSEGE